MNSGQGTLMVRDRAVPAAADVHWQHLQKIGARQHHDCGRTKLIACFS